MGSYNSFARTQAAINGSTPVWCGVVSPRPVGGVLADAFCKAGMFIPAGTPVNLENGILRPIVAWKVISKDAQSHKITIDGGSFACLPSANEILGIFNGATFGTSKTAKVVSIVADTTEGQFVITLDSANIDTVEAGQYLVYAPGQNGSSSAIAVYAPNGYLYNDICLDEKGFVDGKASGAVVDFHGEGLLINRTSGAAFKGAIKALVPNVTLVEY